MMQKVLKITITLIIAFTSLSAIAQDTLTSAAGDSLYREDQFYIGVTYNLVANVPTGVKSRGLSGGLQIGFMRDIPINKRRNIAVAIGAGLAYDQFGQNLFIGKTNNDQTLFQVLNKEETDYNRNRFAMALIEAPIEFRWRTSTPTTYRFWRIYTGFRVGYAYYYKATFKQSGNNLRIKKIKEFDPLRLSATLSFGYNSFNFFAAYSINPFFKNAYTDDGQKVDFRTIKVGLMFYIL